MAELGYNYFSSIYREFRAIEPHDYRSRVHFFEKEEEKIRKFGDELVFEFVTAYALALYKTNDFRRFLVVVEEVLFRSIQFYPDEFPGDDVYQNMLFRKGKAHLKLMELNDCAHTLVQLLRISPTNPDYIKLLGRCWYNQKPGWVKSFRAASIAVFIMTAIITSLEVLFITPFTPGWTKDIQLARNISFLIGFLLLVGSEVVHIIKVWHRLKFYRLEAEERKRQKELDQSL